MLIFFTVLLVAIGLSMDTFSVSLSYGLFEFNKNKIYIMSIMVGIFHFFMPLLGHCFGDFLLLLIPFNEKTIIGIIFLLISIDIIISLCKKEEAKPINSIFDIVLFSFTVSLDSFSTGIALDVFNVPYLLICLIFMIVSFLFTYFGLSMGNFLHNIIGKKAEYIGIFLLLSLSFFYLIY